LVYTGYPTQYLVSRRFLQDEWTWAFELDRGGRPLVTALAATRSDVGLRRLIAMCMATLLLCLGLQAGITAAADAAGRLVSVIVQSTSSSTDARAAVESVGGEVTQDLPIVNGVAARVRQGDLARLQAHGGVWVSPDLPMQVQGSAASTDAKRIQKVVNSDDLWNEGVTGAGVNVALIDTGVYAHPDLAGRIVHCEDFTAERTTAANCTDTYGHGTFMAGLIAGNGASSGGKYRGAAPGAGIVSVKVAGYDGSSDVSKVLAGLQWVVSHKDVYGIRVVNLSLGTDSAQDYRLSPLNRAVERAWDSGVVVVVSAGNTGPGSGSVMKPGDDPLVITVGASNDEGSTAIGDDRVPVFSGRGPTRSNGLAKPDLVSPGVHTVSLRSPGSAIDQKFPSAQVDGSYFKGTGTSMSAATISGVVAQMLSRNPSLTPDQVKFRLMETARQIADTSPNAAGAGLVDAYAAATANVLGVANQQGVARSTGLGLIGLDRAGLGVSIESPIGPITLAGEVCAQLDPAAVSANNPAGLVTFEGTTWNGTTWNGTTWNGTTWNTLDWAGTTWNGTTWNATTWNGTTWNGTTWNNVDWEGTTWNATTWNDVNWDATTWNATTWNSAWYAVAWD
jgi:serine protease AprX